MSNYASTVIPRPGNWQDFEEHTCILFQCILNDPNTVVNGRTGQAQQGVDIYGRRDQAGHHWVGIQCKQKSDGQKLTEPELKREVSKAKTFTPTLSELIIVTTAPDDANIQRIARDITQHHEAEGLFSVDVWGWGTIEREVRKHGRAIEAFHPDLTPFSRELQSLGEQTIALVKDESSKADQILRLLDRIVPAISNDSASAAETSTAGAEALEHSVHSEIDGYRDLLRTGKANTAKNLLDALKERVWESGSRRVRFRILTNMGAAYLSLGDQDKAADSFLEAIAYDPFDRVGLANSALAYLIKEEPQNAIETARRALTHDLENAAAAAHLISGQIGNPDVSDPFSLVPEAVRDTPEVLASAIGFLLHKNNADWRQLARQAADRHAQDKQLQRRAAEAVLDGALSSDHFVLGCAAVEEGGITFEDVQYAATVLQNLWEEVLDAETEVFDSALPHNLALALWVLNECQAAATVLDQALGRSPDDSGIRELRAALYFEADEVDAALALVGDDLKRPDLVLMWAQALASREPERARALIHGQDFSASPQHQRLAAYQVIIESFVQEGQLDQASEQVERFVSDYPGSIIPLVELATLQLKRGDTDADATLTRAVGVLGDERRFSERLAIANVLEEAGRYDKVASVLAGHVDTSHDSPALRRLLFAYINADRRAAANELLTGLSAEVTSRPPYLKALAAINMNRKDFPAAREALDRYLGMKPDDLAMRLRWFQLCLRLGEHDRIETCLSGDVERLTGSPELRMELARWLSQLGFEERALKLAYSVFLYNSAAPQVHLHFMGLILLPGRTISIPLDRDTIDNDVAFEIDGDSGGRSWFIVEPNVELRKDEAFIAPDSEIAKKARGLSSGDIIEWDGHGATWKVVDVKHKYIYALHRSMENFERYFPTTQGLRQITVEPGEDEPFDELFEDVKRRHDDVQRVFDVLDKNMIPIHAAASALGGDIVETRNGLQQDGRKHRVCSGTHPERMRAIEALRSNAAQGCIIDALTLGMIRQLGIEDIVLQICGPIYVTGSTRDLYWARVEELKKAARPSMILYWQEGQLFRHELSQQEWDSAVECREADLNWLDAKTTIVPAEGATDPPEGLRQLNDSIGGNFLDDMLAAQGSGFLLLSQDQVYRVLAEQALGVTAGWLQPLLMLARDENLLSVTAYNKVVIDLISFGDQFISVDGGLLLAAGDFDENSLDQFSRVAERLGGPEAEIFSHIRVTANFLRFAWSKNPVKSATKKQTSILLEYLLRGRRDWQNIIGVIRALIQIRAGPNAELDHYILSWLKGHFFMSAEVGSLPIAGLGPS